MLTVQDPIQNKSAKGSSKVNVGCLMPKPTYKLKLTLKNLLGFCNVKVLHSIFRN